MSEKRPAISFRLIARNAAETLDFYAAGLGAVEILRWIDPESGKSALEEQPRIRLETLIPAGAVSALRPTFRLC